MRNSAETALEAVARSRLQIADSLRLLHRLEDQKQTAWLNGEALGTELAKRGAEQSCLPTSMQQQASRIVLVDHDPGVQQLVGHTLEQAGYEAEIAQSTEHALDEIPHWKGVHLL